MKKHFLYAFLAASFGFLVLAAPTAFANAPSPDSHAGTTNREASANTEVVGAVPEGAAQSVFTVPFMFAAGDSVLPAGTYTVAPMDDDVQLLRIVSKDGRQHAIVPTVWGRGANNDPLSRGLFQFKSYGGDEVMTSIALPGESVRSVVMSKKTLEKDLVAMARIRFKTETHTN